MAGDDFDKRFRKFEKMQRLLDGEDASMSMVSSDAPIAAIMSRELADEAFALLAHRTHVRVEDCETAEEVARRVRLAIERPLQEENAALRKELTALQQQLKQADRRPRTSAPTRAELLDFQARLVLEAAEALAAAAEGQPALRADDALGAALRRMIDRVMLFHRAEDVADGSR